MIPNVDHPKAFTHKGIGYQVVAYFPLTDSQAKKIVTQSIRNIKHKKTNQGKVVQILTHIDRETLNLL